MKYTAQQIRDQRICFENLTEEQFNKLKAHFQKLHANDNYAWYEYHKPDKSFRFYPVEDDMGDVIFSQPTSYADNHVDEDIKASKSITFDQFDFEETSRWVYSEIEYLTKQEIANLLGKDINSFEITELFYCNNQEKTYNEEEVEEIIAKLMHDVHCGDICHGNNVIDFKISPQKWFEQFKNKQ